MPREKRAVAPKTIRKVNATVDVSVRSKNEIGVSPINILAMVIVLVIFGFLGFFVDRSNSNAVEKNKPAVAAVQTIAYDGEDGKNALELLKSKAEVKTQDSSIGIFVISINGVANSEDHFWMFYVNGELGSVAADQYTTKSSDKIEWRYNQFN